MKALLKAILVIGAVLWAERVRSQSTFIFNNYVPFDGIDAPVFDAQGNRLSGQNYVAILYGGLTTDSLAPAWDEVNFHVMAQIPFTFMPGGQDGYFRYSGYVQVSTVPAGVLAWIQVRAWDTRLGGTYDEVRTLGMGGYGESPLFQAMGGDPSGGVPGLPQPLMGLQSFSLRPVVPEPGTVLLLAAGLSLLLFRGRYKRG